MKRFLCAISLLVWSQSLQAAEVKSASVSTPAQAPRDVTLVLRAGLGTVSYEEDVSIEPAKSDWEAAMGTFGGTLVVRDPRGWRLRGQLSFWGSDTDTEQWRGPEGVQQENDLTAGGVEAQGDIGFSLGDPASIRITPWVGLNVRGQRYEREDFFFPEDPDATFHHVDEDFSVATAMVGLDAEQTLNKHWSVAGHVQVGAVLAAEADNSDLGDIEGDGGTIVGAGLAVRRALAGQQTVSLGVRYELQSIDGGVESVSGVDPQLGPGTFQVEWPDNELEQITVEATWSIPL